ncbi:MAG TPA: adenylate/guanylate cyclase domain-containing protein, partial [Actinomycetota bacterium]|nr:adenylate/guanylate cyclase domain-containing protein [Actinomycetota bacterium]
MTALSFPTGTVTFLFTDVEGSTRLLQQLGEPFRQALERHIDLISAAVRDSGGLVVRTEGDGVFAVFEQASSGVAAAAEAQRALASEEWPRGGRIRARMGLHTGAGIASGDDYAGIDVHRAARIAGAGHGGQVLLSSSTTALVEDALVDGLSLRPLGRHRLKDLERPEEIFQLDVAGLETAFPSLRARQAASNLPLQRTSFVGREREKTEVQERLSPGSVVTLLGPGGTGKTRLAVEVAVASADRFDDGVVFVDLAPVEDPG